MILELPIIKDFRGNLTFLENLSQIPFEIGTVKWVPITNIDSIIESNENKSSFELIIALSGSFDVIISYGTTVINSKLNRAYNALLINEKFNKREILNFSTNSLVLIVSSKD
jgi:hypothetical protein